MVPALAERRSLLTHVEIGVGCLKFWWQEARLCVVNVARMNLVCLLAALPRRATAAPRRARATPLHALIAARRGGSLGLLRELGAVLGGLKVFAGTIHDTALD